MLAAGNKRFRPTVGRRGKPTGPWSSTGRDSCGFLRFELRQTLIPIGRRLEGAYLQTMKILFGRYLVACVLLGTTTFVFAGEFKSRIITSSPLMITIPDNHFLKVSNFTQEGGVDRGVVTVTLTDQTDQTGQTGQTANVLTASRIDSSTGGASQNPPEIINRVIIAGPAQVTVAPVLGATLFITYRKLPEEGTSTTTVVIAPTTTPTPTPTVTATPTVTPTATPTPTL